MKGSCDAALEELLARVVRRELALSEARIYRTIGSAVASAAAEGRDDPARAVETYLRLAAENAARSVQPQQGPSLDHLLRPR